MTTIYLTTKISADINTCFDIARDIEAHKLSTKRTKEKAVAGRTTGLCEYGDTITWKATHFGIPQYLTVEITSMNRPAFFADKMIKGAFKSMQHQHHFESSNGKTIMKDQFEYEVPLGVLGKIFDKLVLKNYMTSFLKQRNQVLKTIAEKIHDQI